MKIIIAIDSFKGSLSSLEAGNAARLGVSTKYPEAEIVVLPLADGGEGTTDTLIDGMSGKRVDVRVHDPLGRMTSAYYGILPNGRTAVMEMAAASGITLLKPDELDPLRANTFGLGEMIKDAYRLGCKKYIIGIGGSATTEAGIGMLSALGFRFLDSHGYALNPTLESMPKIKSIDDSQVDKNLLNCHFNIACDVSNPLCGANGSVAIYGPQKGATRDQIPIYDQYLHHFGTLSDAHNQTRSMEYPGAGAAGGLGFAFSSYFKHASLRLGSHIIFDTLGYKDAIKGADLVITGEGKIDSQTFMSKGPGEVAKLAKAAGAKVFAFGGMVDESAIEANKEGLFDRIIAITPTGMELSEAMKVEVAKKNLQRAVEQSLTAPKESFIR